MKINEAQAQALVHLSALMGSLTLKEIEISPWSDTRWIEAENNGYTWTIDSKGVLLGWSDPEKLDNPDSVG